MTLLAGLAYGASYSLLGILLLMRGIEKRHLAQLAPQEGLGLPA